MRNLLFAALAGLLVGFMAAWQVQSMRHDAEMGRVAISAAGALTGAYIERDASVSAVEFQREGLEKELEKALNENRMLDDRIASGADRVYVRATCPSVPATTANASGSSPVAAELDPRYRPVVSRLRERAILAETWARKCQVELRGRSAN